MIYDDTHLKGHQPPQLGYTSAVHVSAIHIYETYHPGAVVKVSVKEEGGTWVTLWESHQPIVFSESRIFKPNITVGLVVYGILCS